MIQSLAKNLGIPSLHADADAERLCSSLSQEGLVIAVWSKDTDNYALGTPIMITEMAGIDEENHPQVTVIILPLLRTYLELTQSQLRDLCIMCGVDFNDGKNIPSFGPIKCYKLIKEYSTIENIGALTGLPVENLKYERCRELLSVNDSGFTHESLELNLDLNKFKDSSFYLFNQYGLIDQYDYFSNIIKFVPSPKFVTFT